MRQGISPTSVVEAGLRAGVLGRLGATWIERIAAGGIVTELDEGRVQPAWQAAPTVVLEGLLRLRARTDVGREWTVGYIEPGGTAQFSLSAPGSVQLQAVTDCTLLVIGPDRLRRWMESDAAFACAVVAAISTEMESMLAEVTGTALRPLRTRVCNHLLYLGQPSRQPGGRVSLTHQDLASAVGSVRDVVTRILDDLQDSGTIELRRGTIVVRDLPGLRRIRDREAGVAVNGRGEGVTAVT